MLAARCISPITETCSFGVGE